MGDAHKYLLNEWISDEPVLLGSEQNSLRSLCRVTEFCSLHLFQDFMLFHPDIVMPHVVLKVTASRK